MVIAQYYTIFLFYFNSEIQLSIHCKWSGVYYYISLCVNNRGKSPAEADRSMLEVARQLEMYGITLYPAKVVTSILD